jgi:hypothetical protein
MSHKAPSHDAPSGFSGHIGVARADITPPIGIYARNWGAAKHDVADGVHHPLTGTAVTLQSTPTSPPLVLLALDLGWWRTPEDEYFVRSGVLEALQLDPARVLINMAHTHAGPSLCREDANQPGGEFIAPYLERLRDTVTALTKEALSNAEPAVLEWMHGKCDLAQNRDLPDPDSDRFLSGYNPSGEADDTLLVGRITTCEGKHLATLVNYACHPVTLAWDNALLSPDWIGTLRETVEQSTNSLCLYLHGASGDVAPREAPATPDIADAHGRVLGYATLATLHRMLSANHRLEFGGAVESGAPIAVWERKPHTHPSTLAAEQVSVTFPLQSMPTLKELEAMIAETADRAFAERLKRKRRIRRAVGEGESTQMPLWVWKVGNSLWVAHPNEAYSALQTQLREAFAPLPVVVMNITNGHFGYLATENLYGYEIYPVWQSPFGRGSLEHLIAESKNALETLSTEES